MRVAVTGANGLLGRDAVAQVAGRHDVLAVGRGPCRLPPGAHRWADADLGDGRSVEDALRELRAEAMLHAGAATDVDGCERDPEMAWRVNVGRTEQVARACRALGARLMAVSTAYVFDGEAVPYSEDDVPNPRRVYAGMKRCCEEAVLLLAPDCAVARVGVVCSGGPGAKLTFATLVVEKLSRGEFAERVAREFGLEVVPVKTADVKLLAPRPLRGALKVERAAGLLRNRPVGIDGALARFRAEWLARGMPANRAGERT